MKVITAIGKKKTGKTTWVKETILKFSMPKYVFDPNMHYTENGIIQFPYKGEKNEIELFLEKVKELRNSVIVIEEATIQLKSQKRQEALQSLCVRCRHQNNILVLCFHSLRSLPTWIFDLTDCVKLFKTNDSINILHSKFEGVEGLEDAFKKVNYLTTQKHASYFLDLNPEEPEETEE